MKLKRLAYLAFTFSIPCFLQAQQAKMNIGIEAGQLNFDVSFKGQPVILSSPLGMNIDNHLLGKEVKNYNPQIQISAESETKRSIFREKDKTKRSKKESAQHSKSRNKSFVMTSVSAL